MKKQICAFYLLLLCACQDTADQPSPKPFTLTGKTNGIPDGAKIYLLEVLTNQVHDSTTVQKNAFRFEGRINDSPTYFYLHTKDMAAFKPIWIESADMTFDAAHTDFGNARIGGSKTQDEAALFFARTDTATSDVALEKIATEFILEYPNNRMSASMLAGYAPAWGMEKVKSLYCNFSAENRESVYGRQISKFIESYRDHQIGDRYTDFEMQTPDAKTIKFSENLDRVTLLEFWASWCGPCRLQNPDLLRIYKKYHDRGFEIVAVSLDFSKDDWNTAIAKDSLPWHHVSDLKGRNSTAGIIYGVNAIPDNFLIDSNGVIVAKHLWGDDLENAIEQTLTGR